MQSPLAETLPFTPFGKLRTGFDALRANGARGELVDDLPFVLSLSKHESGWSHAEPEL